ncbi:DUF1579 domain-containing protein [Solirubrobacter ginsenosidimutans]|uniref:DUF1579 domain-containing protein n=1 Tax=Solirubrobacter ginsenosidimutans TaxID=490573 RepID=A0A9X3MZV9_9ACTN|nr:hypothetical protein [Solirubrobacter ginsenosidimutans]MDA0165865.1 DUF1579 domain-containing protein [Solirubrobacter ginsenosidimutans]
MPELNALHERLAALEGTWEGTEELAPSPWSAGGTATATLTFGLAAGGFAVVQDYRSSAGLTGHGVFSVSGDEVLWHWFDSIGYPPEIPARGGFSGDVLVLERTSPRGTNRTTFALAGSSLRQRVEFDGAVVAETSYRRGA